MKIEFDFSQQLKDCLMEYEDKRCSKDDFVDMGLLKVMAQITHRTSLQIGALIDRKGVVVSLFVFDKDYIE